jgi:hypothetical protein
VLKRRHRAGIDIEVRVELDERYLQAAGFEQRADRRGGEAFARAGTTPPVTKMYLGM